MERRLGAILAADVAGYSRLMGENEGQTLSALRNLRSQIFAPSVEKHRGQVIKSMGDGWLVEFSSVVDAINCAVEVQNALNKQELVRLRIGIHVGDIVHEDEDVFGDGVNISSRLQEIAPPGGIAISDFAHESARSVVRHAFLDSGLKELKNIARKIRVFTWGEDANGFGDQKVGSEDRPSIIVLPFSISGASDSNSWIGDGLTDALTTALSRFSWFITLSRNASQSFKGTQVDIADLRRKISVGYVVEGSLRVAGARVRVNAQLLDATDGRSIWAGQLDGSTDDPFELEDRISRSILSELTTRILGEEERKARLGGDGSAWDLVMQGRSLLWHVNKDNLLRAQELFHQAIEKQPEHGLGQCDLAWSYVYQRLYGWGENAEQATELAIFWADKAVASDNYDAYALAAASQARNAIGKTDDAIALGRRAIEINPHLAIAHAALALALCQKGKFLEAVEMGDMALNISPHDPARSLVRSIRGIYLLMLDRIEDMIDNARELVREFPGMPTGYRQLAVAYALSGRASEARNIVEDHILRLIPGHTATESGRLIPFGPNDEIRSRWVAALIEAGLPE